MPNYCFNYLEVKGSPDALKKFRDKYENSLKFRDGSEQFLWIDFRKVNPDTEYRKELVEEFNSNPELVEEYAGDFKAYWASKDYDYRMEEWGNKWNYNGDEPAISSNNKVLVYRFDTAWSPVIPIIHTLIQDNPDLSFDYEYSEPGNCFGGKIKGIKGGITQEEEYNIDTGVCPECETWNIKPDYKDKYECGCGKTYTQEESKSDED